MINSMENKIVELNPEKHNKAICTNCVHSFMASFYSVPITLCAIDNSNNLKKLIEGKINKFQMTTVVVAPNFTCKSFELKKESEVKEK